MKTRILLFSLLLFGQLCAAQSLTQTQKLASLCKVWGFLKYYHPEVAEGDIDWDCELIIKIPELDSINTKEELSALYTGWINNLGNIDEYKVKPEPKTATPKNKYLQWINDTSIFSDELITILKKVHNRRNTGKNHYVKGNRYTSNAEFTNEKEYSGAEYPDFDLRILTIFRYWNMIEYFFPYKYLMDKNWEKTLDELIPEFYSAKDRLAYHGVIKKMTASIDDSHAYITLPARMEYYKYFPPFTTRIIDGKAIVNQIIDDDQAKANDIQYGDVITAVNGKTVNSLIDEYRPYINASNEAVTLRFSGIYLLMGNTDSVEINYERNGIAVNQKIGRYEGDAFSRQGKKEEETPVSHQILQGNIAYVDLGVLKENDDIKEIFEPLMKTKAIILDVRNYPDGTMYEICDMLSTERVEFVKFTMPDYSCPGTFASDKSLNCGKRNKHPYQGKIIVLLNEETQSHAEFTCMSFKTLPNVTLIGSQTAGADGNVSEIILPGNFKTYMTGLGVYYPDGTETQRIGIVPDIEVHPTIKGIQEHRDEVLERAISFINTGK